MAGIPMSVGLNWENTFQRRFNTNDPIGYITAIKVLPEFEFVPLKLACPYEGTSAASGYTPLTLENPKGAGNTITCVAAMEMIDWKSGQLDPITIRAYFHKDNMENLRTVGSPDIEVGFWMLKKETANKTTPAKNTWYEYFLPQETGGDAALQWSMAAKLKQKSGEGSQAKFEWNVDDEPTKLNDDVQVIGVTFTMKPAGKRPVYFRFQESNPDAPAPKTVDWGNE